ncbi:MAG: RecX family transcriptional regulator [Anaerolineae bacterium]
MGIITALEVQKRNKERVNVYLDGEYAFSVTLIEATRLKKGQQLTEADIRALKDTDEINKAFERAVNFLTSRPRSEAEVRRNLLTKDVPEPVIDSVIARLHSMGYLDDLAFARYWLENRDAFKPRGSMALRYELRQKGIANSIIDTVLEDFDSSDAAYRAAVDKARRLRGSTYQEFRTKLGSFLQRRGFNFATSRDVIEQLSSELTQEEPDFFAEADNDDEDFGSQL